MKRLIGDTLLEIKSVFRRIVGIPDPWKKFRDFEKAIHPLTWTRQKEYDLWLEKVRMDTESNPSEKSDLPITCQDERTELLQSFRMKYQNQTPPRVLIQNHQFEISPAGYSIVCNTGMAMEWMGIPYITWMEGTPFAPLIDSFQPTVVLVLDSAQYHPAEYLQHIDWSAILRYRKDHRLDVGIGISVYPRSRDEIFRRIDHMKRLGVTFGYGFQPQSFLDTQHEQYIKAGIPVLSLEFGANPLVYHPVHSACRDIPYVFLGSSNFEKLDRYVAFAKPIWERHPGWIIGPGWSKASRTFIEAPLHKYIYSRGQVGINVHVPFQMQGSVEINERTYNLAASGIPQLTDKPPLLYEKLHPDSVFAADSPKEYEELFEYILKNPDEAQRRAKNGIREIYQQHTVFHRVESLLQKLKQIP
jgi:hypothetical protein